MLPSPSPLLLRGQTKAGCAPLPAATCLSRQLIATLSLPPTNQGGGAAEEVPGVELELELELELDGDTSDCFECDDAGALRHSKPEARLPKKAEGVETEEAWRRSNCARSLSALCCGGGGEAGAGGGGGGVASRDGGRTPAAPDDDFERRPTSNSRPAPPPPPPELELGGGGEALAATTT